MNIKKKYVYFLCLFLSSYINYAQSNLLNSTTVSDRFTTIDQDTPDLLKEKDAPLAYGNTANRDVLWSKIVWEVIDLKQKINHSLYYPVDSTLGSQRLSLYNSLNKALQQNKFKTYETSYFINEKPLKKIQEELSTICPNTQVPSIVEPYEFDHFKIKGMWYFDKRQGELKYRLLAIAPLIAFDAKRKCGISDDRDEAEENGEDFEEPIPKKLRSLYWAYYPELRQILHESKVFNPDNSVHPISYDHLLNARRFSSYITQEENVYGNRQITDYIKNNSLFQLLESDRIKEEIRNKEIDMWNY